MIRTRYALAMLPLLAVATPAAAAPDCMPIAALMAEYEAEYGETPRWVGVSGKGDGDLAIFTAPNGSWSLFRVVGEIGCLIDFGLSNTTFPKANV